MVATPDLKRYIGKEIKLSLNGARTLQGKLVGYDFFLNLNLQNCVELVAVKKKRKTDDEPAVDAIKIGQAVVRGNSIISIEPVE